MSDARDGSGFPVGGGGAWILFKGAWTCDTGNFGENYVKTKELSPMGGGNALKSFVCRPANGYGYRISRWCGGGDRHQPLTRVHFGENVQKRKNWVPFGIRHCMYTTLSSFLTIKS